MLSIVLAFVFGYGLTSLPLLRAGLPARRVAGVALASDTLSITTMEIVDNAIILAIPGAIEAGLDSLLFWGSLAFALAVAGALTVPVNRWLLARGKGHCAVHETGIHGGPPVKRGRGDRRARLRLRRRGPDRRVRRRRQPPYAGSAGAFLGRAVPRDKR